MALLNGTDLVVKFGADGSEEKIYCATSCTLNINQELVTASCKDSGQWANGIAGQKSWDISTDNLYDPDVVGTGFIDVSDYILSGTNEVSVIFGQEDPGDTIWTGTAVVTSASLTGDDNSPATWSASFTGIGALTRTTQST